MNKEATERWFVEHRSRKTLQNGITKLAPPSELLSHSRVKISRRNEARMFSYSCVYYERSICSDLGIAVYDYILNFYTGNDNYCFYSNSCTYIYTLKH